MRFLESLSCEFLIATNGPQALQILESHQPDLILLDVMMPGMSGFEVCWKIKQSVKTRHIPVIFVTALTEENHLEEGFEVGGIDYVNKPLRQLEVQARVKTHLQLQLLIQQQRELREKIKRLENKTTTDT